jgi:hypothetical protein
MSTIALKNPPRLYQSTPCREENKPRLTDVFLTTNIARFQMKRIIMLLLCMYLGAGSAQAVTIEGMTLWGGTGSTLGTWNSNGQIWDTFPDAIWELGVSSAPGGPLLNAANETITGLSFGNYYLYAEPTSLGSNAKLDVNLSDSTVLTAVFTLAGANGSGTAWVRSDGASSISLGWASGTANLVQGGGNDYYMYAGIGAGAGVVPEPETYAMLLAGLGLLGFAGRRKLQAA